MLYALRLADVRKPAFVRAEIVKLAQNFCEGTQLADGDWLEGFAGRNARFESEGPTDMKRITALTDEK